MVTGKQEAYKKSLIKKLHVIKSQLGLSDYQYGALLDSFGVESSKDMSIDDLLRAISLINGIEPGEDPWRQRCKDAIRAYLSCINKNESDAYIQGMACRASGYDDFYKIPTSRLRDISYEFRRKAKISANVTKLVKNDVDYVSFLN